jgi:hypothetical protein
MGPPARLLQQWRRVVRSLLPCLAANFVFVVGAVVGLCLAAIRCGCVNSVLWNCVVWYVPTPCGHTRTTFALGQTETMRRQ